MSFWGDLADIGDEFRQARSEIHVHAIERVMNTILRNPDMIDKVAYDHRDLSQITKPYTGRVTMTFKGTDQGIDPLYNAIRFTIFENAICKIETSFDQGWGDYKICGVDSIIKHKAKNILRNIYNSYVNSLQQCFM
jgi:hypothetical protein